MTHMRTMLLLMALIAVTQALSVGPMIYEQKNMGDPSLPEFLYSMSADCTASTVTISVMDDNFSAVSEADVYLEYTQFSSQVISSTKTDAEGVAISRLPGSVKLMQGLFIMVIEKYGYQNKEIHFDLSPCNGTAANYSKPAPPTKNLTNQTPPRSNATQINTTQNAGNKSNSSQNITGNAPATGSICPSAILVAALAFGGGLISLYRRNAPRGRSRRYKSFKK